MIINKGIQAIAKNIASDIKVRPTLAGLLFNKNKIVATDSFKLMEVSITPNIYRDTPELKNFKKIDSNNKFMLSSEDISILKIPKLKNHKYNIIQLGNLNDDSISLGTNDTKRDTIINTKCMEDAFPDYESFFTKTNFEVGMNIDHLMDILKTYKDFGIDDIIMKFNSNNNKESITIINKDDIKDKNIEQVKSILMPLRIN